MFNLRNHNAADRRRQSFLLCCSAFCFFLLNVGAAFAQTTTFTYQGRFTDSTVVQPTNGVYNMQFALFDAVAGGNQIGATITVPAVSVVNGIFTVPLDYTAAGFDGAARFLQITVVNTVLSPRQEITSAPHAIAARKALLANDSNKLGGIDADQYVTGQVVRSVNNLTNNVTLAAGSNITITPVGNTLTIASTGGGGGSGINNQTTLQAGANFNIDGTGAANIFNAATQYNIGGNRVLGVGGGNIFAGSNAGTGNTTGGDNAFVGTNAGLSNLSGFNNAFFGTDSGRGNTGNNNSFFGRSSGFANTTGIRNVFIGVDAGRFNQSGSANSFVGTSAGNNNIIGGNNTAIGDLANFGSNNLTFATALGAGAIATNSNTVVLGRTADTVVAPNLLQIGTLGVGGSLVLCRNASNQISTCTLAAFGGTFIENSTAPQTASNFNISGSGTVGGLFSANIVNSQTTYKIGGANVFGTPNSTSVVAGQSSNFTSAGSNSAFFGFKAGQSANGFSQANTFIGSEAGELTTSGGNNTFVGRDAGFFNISGSLNSFFGSSAGKSNTTANANSFFGYESGLINSTGTRNAFFGFQAGRASGTVDDNSFFGYQAGTVTNGGGNTFVGSEAGNANTNGTKNTYLGFQSGSGNGSKNTVVGSEAGAGGNENTVIGQNSSVSGSLNTSIGTGFSSSGNSNTLIGYFARTDSSQFSVNNSTAIGAGAVVNSSNTVVLGTDQDVVRIPGNLSISGSVFAQKVTAAQMVVTGGSLKMTVLASPTNTGNQPLCLNGSNLIAACPSSFNIASENSVQERQPQIEAQAAQIKEQNAQIAQQAEQIKQMQTNIEALKQTVCAMNPAAKICGNQ